MTYFRLYGIYVKTNVKYWFLKSSLKSFFVSELSWHWFFSPSVSLFFPSWLPDSSFGDIPPFMEWGSSVSPRSVPCTVSLLCSIILLVWWLRHHPNICPSLQFLLHQTSCLCCITAAWQVSLHSPNSFHRKFFTLLSSCSWLPFLECLALLTRWIQNSSLFVPLTAPSHS